MNGNFYYQQHAVNARLNARRHEADLERALRAAAPAQRSRTVPSLRPTLAALAQRMQALFAKPRARHATG